MGKGILILLLGPVIFVLIFVGTALVLSVIYSIFEYILDKGGKKKMNSEQVILVIVTCIPLIGLFLLGRHSVYILLVMAIIGILSKSIIVPLVIFWPIGLLSLGFFIASPRKYLF